MSPRLGRALSIVVGAVSGLDVDIGRYPLTIHSAGWGIFVNLAACVAVSALTQPREGEAAHSHRLAFHDFLRSHTRLPEERRKWKAPVWILTVVWFLFAVGPFAVLGNETDPTRWMFGIPTLWVWQLVWWIVGCVVIYLLAFKLQMSTAPEGEVESLVDSA